MSAKLALRRLKQNAVTKQRHSLIVQFMREKAARMSVQKAFESFQLHLASEMTQLNKKARSYYKVCLLSKGMHSLQRAVDKTREVNQILTERREREKAKYMSLWR
jgi:hypothetical protein